MARPSLHIIYVPGLGGRYDSFRQWALRRWQTKAVRVTMFPIRWHDRDETYQQKIRRLRALVVESNAKRIVLIGESAGGAVVVTEMLQENTRVDKAITICGKNKRADRVSPQLYVNNPALKDAMLAVDEVLAEHGTAQSLTVFRSPFDPVIHKVDTLVPGAKRRLLLLPGHIGTIFASLLLLRRMMTKEALQDNL